MHCQLVARSDIGRGLAGQYAALENYLAPALEVAAAGTGDHAEVWCAILEMIHCHFQEK